MRPIRDYPRADYDAVADGPSRLTRLRRALSTAVGAVVATALLLALGVWFYRLGARDAESVPIIRASAEPTKTRPEEPGGAVTPHQEITSYAAGEGDRSTAAAVVVAPPPPEPRREDVAMGTLAPSPAERPDTAPGDPAPRHIDEAPRARPDEAPSDEAEVAEVLGALTETGSDAEAEADEIAVLVLQATLEAATTPKPDAPAPDAEGSIVAPLPPARPADLHARIDASVRSAEESAAELARRAAESPVQIQLAADPDERAVRSMWRRIAEANSDILHDRALAVQRTVSGGTAYYRLRVGPFADVSEARAVCQALKARGQDCIVARNG